MLFCIVSYCQASKWRLIKKDFLNLGVPPPLLNTSNSTPSSQFLAAVNNIPGSSPVLNSQQQLAFLQHQQFQQQMSQYQQMRQFGFPVNIMSCFFV